MVDDATASSDSPTFIVERIGKQYNVSLVYEWAWENDQCYPIAESIGYHWTENQVVAYFK